ncbi:glutamyl-tRNA(Gln) amidotransferase subunit A [Luminiphilus syltensis NOR5-1B]|uniref:Glutamyl-tRNA(Gln) amidotransferase subunit A n=1 Tax=Luminiphilus syltensis NOR5-1B TaxID=565045 RepID=B8KU00_9GAMM|nr:amidase [Luminiphilus syltensis]EED35704.1 glutamyl-tRNA(Gln) amidotransferase subunit A [Luminiphilus syltensis NOR5-1B]
MSATHTNHQQPGDATQRAIEHINPLINAVIHPEIQAPGNSSKPTRTVLIKDCMHVAGMPTTYGSQIFSNNTAETGDATVVGRLRQHNVTFAGKAHLTEFCFGATGQNECYGNCKNPWDTDRITGGSSSGSAAAVASGMVRMALGTDTGGSVRVPASLCGVVGLRPTMGRVPNTGCLDVSTISDTIGPLAASVTEAAWLFDAIHGYDAADPNSIATGDASLPTLEQGVEGIAVGRLGGYFSENIEYDIESRLDEVARLLESQGARLIDTPPENDTAIREHHAFRFILADVADARSDLMRDTRLRECLGAEVRRRIELGQAVSGVEYAASIRSLLGLRRWLRNLFSGGTDLLLLPTTPMTAPLWRDSADMVETTRKVAGLTYDLGATGIPSVSVPMGLDRNGLPMGAMLAASWGNEALLLRAARAVERGLSLDDRPSVFAGTSAN